MSRPGVAAQGCTTDRERQGPFFGRTVKILDGPNFRLGERTYRAGTHLARHSHDVPYLCFVVGGWFTESIASGERCCERFGVVSNLSGEPHVDRIPVPTRIFNIEFTGESGGSLWRPQRPARYHQGEPVVWLALKLHDEFRNDFDGLAIAGESLVHELAAELNAWSAPRSAPVWLRRVREAIHDGFRQSVGLDDLSRIAGVHAVHLCRSFHHFYGATIGDTVRRLRVDFASRALAESDVALATVALDCGFHDQSHFTRTFHRCTTMTPAEFRRRYRHG